MLAAEEINGSVSLIDLSGDRKRTYLCSDFSRRLVRAYLTHGKILGEDFEQSSQY